MRKLRCKYLISSLLLLTSSLCLKAQYYQSGTEAFSTRWRTSSKGSINLIYPSDAERYASIYLNALSKTDTIVGLDYGLRATPIDVVLHNHNVLSNGLVVWTPRRMELVTFPLDLDNGAPWHHQLATHEMRHVKQMNALNHNVFRVLSFILGQQSPGIASALVPPWFLEGDAVFAETRFTTAGRGRSARFYQHYRTFFLDKRKPYRYDKWLHGSFKDFVPNHYAFGYQLVSYANSIFGPERWAQVLDYTTKWPIVLKPFELGIKRRMGLSAKHLALDALNYADSIWTAKVDTQSVHYQPFTPLSKVYTNYRFPFCTTDGAIVCYKTSLSKVPEFVMITSTINTKNQKKELKERRLINPGHIIGLPHIDDSLIIWSELRQHVRWEHQNYGRVMCYNYLTHKLLKYRQLGMFHSPIYSASHRAVVALLHHAGGHDEIVVLRPNQAPEPLHHFEPKQSPQLLRSDGHRLYVLLTTSRGKQIVEVDTLGISHVVVPATHSEITDFDVHQGNIYFSTTEGFVENIFCYNILSHSTFRITNSRYGAHDPRVLPDGRLAFSCYSADGYYVSMSDIKFTQTVDFQQLIGTVPEILVNCQPIDFEDDFSDDLKNNFNVNLKSDLKDSVKSDIKDSVKNYLNDNINDNLKIDSKNNKNDSLKNLKNDSLKSDLNVDFNIDFKNNLSEKTADSVKSCKPLHLGLCSSPGKPLPLFKQLFNFHSWAPLFFRPTELAAGDLKFDLGATIMSQNITGSLVVTAGYGFKPRAEYRHMVNVTAEYSGIWPKITASFDLEPNAARLFRVKGLDAKPNQQRRTFQLALSIPLRLSSGRMYTFLQPSVALLHSNDYFFIPNQRVYRSGHLSSNIMLYFSTLRPLAHRDLRSRWGFTLKLNYQKLLKPEANNGSMVAATARIYLPGAFANHSIMLQPKAQHQFLKNYYLANRVDFPRGYDHSPSENFWGIDINYSMPICYPDINIGPLVYFKRLAMNLFCDYAQNHYFYFDNEHGQTPVVVDQTLVSCGAEISTNFNFLRFSFPFELTCRLAWPRGQSRPVTNFAINVAFN